MDGVEPKMLEVKFERCKREFYAVRSEMDLLLSEDRATTEEGCTDQMRRGLQLMKRWADAGERLRAAQAAILGAKSERAN
jgi:hypothetical protein